MMKTIPVLPSIEYMKAEIKYRQTHLPYQLLLNNIEDSERKNEFIRDTKKLLKITGEREYNAIISTNPNLDNEYLSVLRVYCQI